MEKYTRTWIQKNKNKNKQTNKRKIQEPKNLLRTDYHEAWSGDYLLLSKDYNILSCSHNILYYSPKILFCSHKKDTLFPQERYFVHSIYYFVPTTYHIGTGTHKYGWVNQVLWEFMSIPMQASHHRQATNTKQKETRKQKVSSIRVCVYIYGIYIYDVEWSRALDVRLSEWCCSISMVWVQIPSREEQKFDSSKI
jgi:hypothetical protein